MSVERVAVIGGGIIGCAIAWRLAQQGVHVVVIDGNQPVSKASWAAAGMLLPILEDPSPLRPLAEASFAEFPDFVAEVERATGVDAGLIIEGPHSGSVDNRRLGTALQQAATRAGAEFRIGVPARKVDGTTRFQHVELTDGSSIDGDSVVIAAGAWSSEIRGLPVRLPVVPVRGQMLAVKHDPPFVDSIVENERCYLVPRGDRLLIGATVERVGFDERTTPDGIAGLLECARELAPDVAGMDVMETWAGLRPGTPDDLPILGADPRVEGLFYATGHYRNGILLTPITARAISELIVLGKTDVNLTRFKIDRFVVDVDHPHCDLCGAAMTEWHCRIICSGCGYQRDCSDP